jgi:tripartite-type tricarboxylate transporter receptor subunit TctC
MVMNPHLYESLPYDPVKDFEPISLLASVAQVLCVHASTPVKSVQDLIRLAKSKPGELTYGSTGVGSTTHLNTELLKSAAGINVAHVPYKGGSQALTDLAGGHISMLIIAISLAQPQIAAGTVRPLAVAGSKRSPLLPDVPTFAEAGLSGYEAQPWFGLMAPARTSKDILAKVRTEAVAALHRPELQPSFRAQGLDLVGSTPEEFAAFMNAENAKSPSGSRSSSKRARR